MAASPPRTPSGRRFRPRPRRGSLERPVSGRIYRTAWAVLALPLLVLAFTVGRPEPLPRPSLPPSFDEGTARSIARELARLFPDRSPGNPKHAETATWVAEQLRSFGLQVEERPFTAEIPGQGVVQLVNVVAEPLETGPERSPRTIVVMADRDNLGLSPGLDDNASGTGALIELARDLAGVKIDHTLLFVSTDGGAYGNLGAEQLARDPGFRRTVLAVVNLDSVAGAGRVRLELAGDGARSPASALAATADASVLRRTGVRAAHTNGLLQLFDLAFPFSLYGQAPLLGHGVSALTLTTSGSRPPRPGEDVRRLDAARFQAIGRATQALVLSLDTAGEAASGTESYVYLGGRVLRGFAVVLLLLAGLVAPIASTIDLHARLRRRGGTTAAAFRSLRSRLGVWLFGGGVAALFAAVGLFPHEGDRPLAPDTVEAQTWPSAAIAGLAMIVGLGWFAARVRLVPRAPTQRLDELAGHLAAMSVLCVIAIGLAVVNPYAVLFVLPALHAWLWVPHVRDGAPWLRLLVLLAGLVGPAAVLAVFAVRLDLGFDAPWYVATLFTVGYAPWAQFLLLLGFGSVAGQMGAILFGRYAPYPSADEGPERGMVRETVRQAILLGRRLRAGRTGLRDPYASRK